VARFGHREGEAALLASHITTQPYEPPTDVQSRRHLIVLRGNDERLPAMNHAGAASIAFLRVDQGNVEKPAISGREVESGS
jgi:hypothetical protein